MQGLHAAGEQDQGGVLLKFHSFRVRLLFWSWTLLLVALILLFHYSISSVGENLIRETEDQARRELDSVEWLAYQHPAFEDARQLDSWSKGLGKRLGVRITYIVAGRVLADTEVPYSQLAGLDDHSSRAEILEAVAGGTGLKRRYSDTLGKDMIYIARSVDAVKGLPPGILRLAVPFSDIKDRLTRMRSNFLWLFMGTLCFAALLSLFLSSRLTRSIRAFSKAAQDIGRGSYEKTLRSYPGGEFRPLAEAINNMAGNIKAQIMTIEDQRGQLKAMFEGMSEGVMVLDSRGRLESFNKAFDGMYPVPINGVGMTPLELTRNLELQDAVDVLLAGEGRRESVSMQLELLDKRFLDVSVVPFLDDKGVRKLILVFHDITAVKQSEKALRDFVANASHQLRTPLTSIKGYAEAMQDALSGGEKRARDFLGTILKNADHMNDVITSLLALAKSEQAGLKTEIARVPVREVAEQAVAGLLPKASDKRITLVNGIAEEANLHVLAERDGLLHVLLNLLDNAVKYGPENGTIRILAREEGGEVVVCVEDEGEGISREHREKVFERFYRVDENLVQGDGSAGLGLAICRRIVNNFGGQIWCEGSEEPGGKGAVFCFRLKNGR